MVQRYINLLLQRCSPSRFDILSANVYITGLAYSAIVAEKVCCKSTQMFTKWILQAHHETKFNHVEAAIADHRSSYSSL